MAEDLNPAGPVSKGGKIKVLIVTLDTGTSERWAFEAEVFEITPTRIVEAYDKALAEAAGEMAPAYPAHTVLHWVPKVDFPCAPASFIMEGYDPAFLGRILVMGFVQQIGEIK